MSRSFCKIPMIKKMKSKNKNMYAKRAKNELNQFLDSYLNYEINLELDNEFRFKQTSKIKVYPKRDWDWREIDRYDISYILPKPYKIIKNKYNRNRTKKCIPQANKMRDELADEFIFPKYYNKYNIPYVTSVIALMESNGINNFIINNTRLNSVYHNILKYIKDRNAFKNNIDSKYMELIFNNNNWDRYLKKEYYSCFDRNYFCDGSKFYLKLKRNKKLVFELIKEVHLILYNNYLKNLKIVNSKSKEINIEKVYKYYIK